MRRWILASLVLAVMWSSASPAASQELELPPPGERASEETERAFFDAVPCPDVTPSGLERATGDFDQRNNVTINDANVSIICRYPVDEGRGVELEVAWIRPGAARTDHCDREAYENTFPDDRPAFGDVVLSKGQPHGSLDLIAIYREHLGSRDLGVGLDAEFEALIEFGAQFAAPCPVRIECPTLFDWVPEVPEFRTERGLSSQTCRYAHPDGSPAANFQKVFAHPTTPVADLTFVCSEPTTFSLGWGTEGSNGTIAALTYYNVFDAAPVDVDILRDAARTIRDSNPETVATCEGAEIVPFDEFYTPLPPEWAAAFSEEVIAGARPPIAGAGSADDPFADDTTAPIDTPAAPEPSAGGDPGGGAAGTIGTVVRVLSVAAIVISVLLLVVAFVTMRRPTRVRPRMEALRMALPVITGVALIVVFSRSTPVWAIAAAVAAGAVLGWWQGTNLEVFLKEKGLYARRNQIAIVAFAAGLILGQVAGLLNRTGVASLGVAASFLSAALTAGIVAGRRGKIQAARAAATVVVLAVVIAPALLIVTSTAGGAQEDPPPLVRGAWLPEDRTDAANALIDALDWTEIELRGGLFDRVGKPPVTLSVPAALGEAPDPVNRTVEWVDANGRSYSVTESFTFTSRADGFCCSVDYEGDATVVESDGTTATLTAAGALDEIHSVAVEGFGGGAFGPGVGAPFGPAELQTFDDPESCGRLVGVTRDRDLLAEAGGAGDVVAQVTSGEFRADTAIDTSSTMTIDCDLGGLRTADILELMPPAPSADDVARRSCPVLQEVVGTFAMAAGETDGLDAGTVGALIREPNGSACGGGTIGAPVTVGLDGRGNTRHEIAFDFAQPRRGEWSRGYNRWAYDDNWRWMTRPYEIPAEERCEVADDGTVQRPPGDEECATVSFHTLDGETPTATEEEPFVPPEEGQIWITTDWNYADGPNVTVVGQFPWGSYSYRCHHCEPGDPSIGRVIAGWNQFGAALSITGPGAAPETAPAEDESSEELAAEESEAETDELGAEELADLFADEDATDAERAAIAAALVGIFGSAAAAALGLAESGMSLDDLRRELGGDDGADPSTLSPGSTVVDQWGDELTVRPDGMLEFFDEDADSWRVLPADRAQAIITEQIGEMSLYDPFLERRVYFDDPREMDAYADRVNRRTSADFWDRTEADWNSRRDEWQEQRNADARAMAADRALIERWEAGQAQFRDRALAGAIRAVALDPTLEDAFQTALAADDYRALSEIYSGWMYDQIGASRQEAADHLQTARRARQGELAARTLESAARTGMVVVTGPAGVAYTAAGLATINAASEGILAAQRGEPATQIGQRMGLGVLAGARDAAVGALGRHPLTPPGVTHVVSGWGDALEAYTRARIDGASADDAWRAAEISFAAGFGSGVLGAGLDHLPPGMVHEGAQLGLGGMTGAWSTWMHGGDPWEGFQDGVAGAAGGRVGGSLGGRLSQRADPGALGSVINARTEQAALGALAREVGLEESILQQALADGKPRGVIPIEQQSQLIQDAFSQRIYETPDAEVRFVADENGIPQPVRIEPDPTELRPVTDQRLVLEGLTDTAGSRTGKNAPAEVQATINNTRDQLYGRSNQRTIAAAAQNPDVQALLRPGDELVFDNFSTPGETPTLGADRDARLVILRTEPDGTQSRIEVDRQHWEAQAYGDMAAEIRTVYDETGGMPTHLVDQHRARVEELSHQLAQEPDVWTPERISDRALSEVHNQLFTDRTHVEASSANSDQGVRWVSVVDRDTITAVDTRLRGEGLIQDGDELIMRTNPRGESEMVLRPQGDVENELVLDQGVWRGEHEARATELAEAQARWEADPENNERPALQVAERTQVTSEVQSTKDAAGTITDNRGAQLMWEEKTRFYAELNPAEAVEQARKGVAQLLAQREGMRAQGLEVPPLSSEQARAMLAVAESGYGTALPDQIPDLTRQLGAYYGNPDMTLAQSLARMSQPHEDLAMARPATGPAPPPVDSTALLRAALDLAEREEDQS